MKKRYAGLIPLALLMLSLTGCSSSDYKQVQKLIEEGDYAAAAEKLVKLGDYQDSPQILQYCNAIMAAEEGRYEEAIEILKGLTGFNDSDSRVKYYQAQELIQSGSYEDLIEAKKLLAEIPDFLDSSDLSAAADTAAETLYNDAVALISSGDYDGGYAILDTMADYGDAAQLVVDSIKERAEKAFEEGSLEDAKTLYEDLKARTGSEDYDDYIKYCEASAALADGDYNTASSLYTGLGDFQDSKDNLEAIYQEGKVLLQSGAYEDAEKRLSGLADYEDASGLAAVASKLTQAFVDSTDFAEYVKTASAAELFELLTINENYIDQGSEDANFILKAIGERLESGEALEDGEVSENVKNLYEKITQKLQYNEAKKILEEGNYAEAYGILESISDYEDSLEIIRKSKEERGVLTAEEYLVGKTFTNENNILTFDDDKSISIDQNAENYFIEEAAEEIKISENSETVKGPLSVDSESGIITDAEGKEYQAVENWFSKGQELMESGDYEEAIKCFNLAVGVEDAAAQIDKCNEEIKAAEEAAKKAEEESKAAEEESKKAEEESKAADEAAQKAAEEESKAADEAAQKAAEEESKAADEAAQKAAEEESKAAEEAAQKAAEEESKAAEEAAKKAAEEALANAYNAAVELMNSGDYENAIAAFTELGEYADSADQVLACQEAITELEKESAYNDATKALMDKDYITAYNAYQALGDYNDSAEKLAAIETAYKNDLIKHSEAGDVIQFGMFENKQTSWLVLENDGQKVMLLSENVIENIQYNEKQTAVSWEDSSLYQWMNNSYINNAFANAEKECIADKSVVILSADEVEQYMSDISSRVTEPAVDWWVRTDEAQLDSVAYVDSNGNIIEEGAAVSSSKAIRPVISIDISQLDNYSENSINSEETEIETEAVIAESPTVGFDLMGFNQADTAFAKLITVGKKNSAAVSGGDVVIWGQDTDNLNAATHLINVVSVALGTDGDNTVIYCLKSDGTVTSVGGSENLCKDYEKWTNIVEIVSVDNHLVGLKSNGYVEACGEDDMNQCFTLGWQDVVKVVSGQKYTAALKNNGKVYAIGDTSYGQMRVGSWKNMIDLAAGDYHVVGLMSNGTLKAVGLNEDGQCDITEWTDIIAVAAGGNTTVGLKYNGTVVATIKDEAIQNEIAGWTNIVSIAAGDGIVVGLKNDGTVLLAGDDSSLNMNGSILTPKTTELIKNSNRRINFSSTVLNAVTTQYIQYTLNMAGYESGPIDGLYGPITTAAVKAFQKDMGLEATGIADSETLIGISNLQY